MSSSGPGQPQFHITLRLMICTSDSPSSTARSPNLLIVAPIASRLIALLVSRASTTSWCNGLRFSYGIDSPSLFAGGVAGGKQRRPHRAGCGNVGSVRIERGEDLGHELIARR